MLQLSENVTRVPSRLCLCAPGLVRVNALTGHDSGRLRLSKRTRRVGVIFAEFRRRKGGLPAGRATLLESRKMRDHYADVAPNLYEIPITWIANSPRKHMCQVALQRRPSGTKRLPHSCSTSMCRPARLKEHPMLDLIMLAIGLGFFALLVGYAYACDSL
jgi:hypothetical protein